MLRAVRRLLPLRGHMHSKYGHPPPGDPQLANTPMSDLAASEKDISVVSFVPTEQLRARVARIYKPAASAMQSGQQRTCLWRLEFAPTPDEFWTNPLTGWSSSADPMHMVMLEFPTAEDAVKFARKNGWQFEVSEPHEPEVRGKSYADNFKYHAPRRAVWESMLAEHSRSGDSGTSLQQQQQQSGSRSEEQGARAGQRQPERQSQDLRPEAMRRRPPGDVAAKEQRAQSAASGLGAAAELNRRREADARTAALLRRLADEKADFPFRSATVVPGAPRSAGDVPPAASKGQHAFAGGLGSGPRADADAGLRAAKGFYRGRAPDAPLPGDAVGARPAGSAGGARDAVDALQDSEEQQRRPPHTPQAPAGPASEQGRRVQYRERHTDLSSSAERRLHRQQHDSPSASDGSTPGTPRGADPASGPKPAM